MRRCWVRFVKWKYPNYVVVEENTIRSILDQGRNPVIYCYIDNSSYSDWHPLHFIATHYSFLTIIRRGSARSSCKGARSWRVWRVIWRVSLPQDGLSSRPCSRNGASMSGRSSTISPSTTIWWIRHALFAAVPLTRAIYRSAFDLNSAEWSPVISEFVAS